MESPEASLLTHTQHVTHLGPSAAGATVRTLHLFDQGPLPEFWEWGLLHKTPAYKAQALGRLLPRPRPRQHFVPPSCVGPMWGPVTVWLPQASAFLRRIPV